MTNKSGFPIATAIAAAIAVAMLIFLLERVMGLEPTISAWKANVLPLHYTRVLSCKWCGRRDLNSYALRHWNLNPARLPIPPRPQAHYLNLVTRRRFELRTP